MVEGKSSPAQTDVDQLEFDPFPRYSARGKLSRDVFVDAYNDVMVYFEDVGYEEFYKRLLRVVVPSLAISDIFCVGGKTELFKELRRTEKIVAKPQLFIADLDFDDLFVGLGSERNLVYLRKYSIENYWVEPSIFYELIVAEKKGQKWSVLNFI